MELATSFPPFLALSYCNCILYTCNNP